MNGTTPLIATAPLPEVLPGVAPVPRKALIHKVGVADRGMPVRVALCGFRITPRNHVSTYEVITGGAVRCGACEVLFLEIRFSQEGHAS